MAESLSASRIYDLGIWLGYLEAVTDSGAVPWGDVRECLQSLAEYRTAVGVEFLGNDARSELYSLARTYKYSYKRPFAKEDCAHLSGLVQKWYGRLEEISRHWVASTPTTSLDISKLSSGAGAFFEEGEWSLLSEIEQQDLNEAVVCLLANSYTASEFMALRAVESLLRRWYHWKTDKSIEHVRQADILDALDSEFPDKGRPKEISALFHLKNRRNSLAHPEMISNEENASVTFIYVVNTFKAVAKLPKVNG